MTRTGALNTTMKRLVILILLCASCSPKLSNSRQALDENLIYWNANRPLAISDFKGSKEKRPFQAATYSGLQVLNPVNAWSGKTKVIVRSYFDPELSYFKRSERDSSVLAHEQLHFDITELYARKLKKAILEACGTTYAYFEKRDSIYQQVTLELSEKQDAYDTEVYADQALQGRWQDWTKDQLDRYEEYATKEIELKAPLFYSNKN